MSNMFTGGIFWKTQPAWCIEDLRFVWRGNKYFDYWPRLRKGKGAAGAGQVSEHVYTVDE